MRSILVSVFLAAIFAPQAALAGDPYNDVNFMRTAFARVRSVTAVERFSGGDVATVEYAAPDRYHITTPHGQVVLAGNVEYAKRSGGQWVPTNRGAEHQTLLSAVWQLAGPPSIDIHQLFRITSLGAKTVDRTTLRGYLLHDIDGAYDETLWIDEHNLPVTARIEMPDESVDIHYVGYNLSMLIATPVSP